MADGPRLSTETNVLTTFSDSDRFMMSENTTGTTYVGAVCEYSGLLAAIQANDWIKVTGTWTYASATTITIPSDGTTTYQRGDRLRFKQGGAYKYFAVYSVTSTLLTIIGNADYTLANAAITDVYYSRVNSPFGWPDMFNYTPVVTGYSTDPTDTVYQYEVRGGLIRVTLRELTAGTSDSTSLSYSLPCAAKTVTNGVWVGYAVADDNGAALTSPARLIVASAGTSVSLNPGFGGGTWTASGNKRVNVGEVTYPF